MSIDDVKNAINKMVQEHGYFVIGYLQPKQVGDMAPASYSEPEAFGNLLIIGKSTKEEFEALWRPFTNHKPAERYFYRAIID